jgi:NADPH-dependent 2,4-dienoyl-CoA reductase/sulfur reductase-like enzyme/nitrite reductase/ring-hydroxylating ferredoxin subunit
MLQSLNRSQLRRLVARPLDFERILGVSYATSSVIHCKRDLQKSSRLRFTGAVAGAGIFLSGMQYSQILNCESRREIQIGKDAEFIDGQMYEVAIGEDRHVLISRHEGKLYATGSKCSHYGYPLAKGVKCEGEVICPLHDAAFDIKTGKPVRGPGLDAIPTYPVRVSKSGEVFVTVPSEVFPAKVPLSMCKRDPKNPKTFVVVGGGAAGLAAVETLRQEGYTGRLILLSAENHLPYDRPVLSKKLPIKGKIDGLYLRNAEHFADADIEIRLGSKVDSIDAKNNTVRIGSEEIRYDKVLVATGGRPRELFIPGCDAKNVFLMRTIDDALAINEFAAEKGQRVVIIGGSFIGMEIASTLIQKGVDVTVVAKTSVPYERVFGKKVGAFFANLLSEREIRYLGNSAAKIIRVDRNTGCVNAVELDDGDVLPADAVIIGAGVIPNNPVTGIEFTSDGSISCTPFLNSKDNKDLFAAGDICSFPYVKTGQELRVEHWDVAIQQGRVAALNMLDKKVPFNEVPYFWTMVFGKSLRYVGNVGSEGVTFDNVIIEGDLAKGEFVAYYTKGDRIAAVATVGRDPVAVACGELMRQNLMPSVAEIQLGVVNSEKILERLKDINDKKKKAQIIKKSK